MKEILKKWLAAMGVRAVKTAAQAALGVIGASAAMGAVDWRLCGSAVLLATIVSGLTSVAGLPEVSGGDSLAKLVAKSE